MQLLRARLAFGTIALCALAAALALPGPRQQADQGAPHRTSNDPPVAGGGKLGQDVFLSLDHRDLAGLKSLLKGGADPNSYNGLGFSPLYIAAASHQLEAMQALLDAGAKVDSLSTYGTALMFAAETANTPGAKLLLAKGADPTMDRTDGKTVLMMAANSGSPDLVAELLGRRVDVNVQDENGATAMLLAARNGALPVVRLLLDAGARVELANHQGRTPLMDASINGHGDVVGLLLKSGAAVDAKDASGRTALVLAATYGDYPEVAKALLHGGADRNAADAKGRTAGSLAAARGHVKTAEVLGAKGSSQPRRTERQAVVASLSLIQSSMATFAQRATCVSCHQEGLGRIVTGAAKKAGFRLNPAVVQVQEGRLLGMVEGMRPLHEGALKSPEVMKQVPLIEINEVVTGDSWFLAGMAEHGQPKTEAITAMARVLERQQSPDGAWRFSLPRVPLQSSFFTFTALAVRALNTYAMDDEATHRILQAKTWLAKATPQTSEDRAGRLLGLKWSGASKATLRKAAADILADQHADGGWGQTPGLQSDAYATGQAIYALREGMGITRKDPAVQRGLRFLLRTQDDDGSWFVNKRALPVNNYLDGGFPHGQSQYASFNGTCWATLALLPYAK